MTFTGPTAHRSSCRIPASGTLPRAPVMLAATFRTGQADHALMAAIERASAEPRPSHPIALGPLTPADAETLDRRRRCRAERERLYEASGGNPFYLLQLARMTGDSGAGRAPPRATACPRRSSAAIIGELDALSAPARRLAEAAAVAGDPFELDLAMAAAGDGRRGSARGARRADRPATSCDPPRCRAGSTSAIRSCGAPSTSPARPGRGLPRTSAAPTRSRRAAPRPPHARTTSSTPHAMATWRRSQCCARPARRRRTARRRARRAGSGSRSACCPRARRAQTRVELLMALAERRPPPGGSRTAVLRCSRHRPDARRRTSRCT